MTEYNATQSKYRDRCKDRIQRQLEISECPSLSQSPRTCQAPSWWLLSGADARPQPSGRVGPGVLPPSSLGPLTEQEALSPHSRQDYYQRRAGRHVGKREVGHLHGRRELPPGWGPGLLGKPCPSSLSTLESPTAWTKNWKIPRGQGRRKVPLLKMVSSGVPGVTHVQGSILGFETGSCEVPQACFKLPILLPQLKLQASITMTTFIYSSPQSQRKPISQKRKIGPEGERIC